VVKAKDKKNKILGKRKLAYIIGKNIAEIP
jgi:ribosomal protein S6